MPRVKMGKADRNHWLAKMQQTEYHNKNNNTKIKHNNQK
jgi:hypothetical protein